MVSSQIALFYVLCVDEISSDVRDFAGEKISGGTFAAGCSMLSVMLVALALFARKYADVGIVCCPTFEFF